MFGRKKAVESKNLEVVRILVHLSATYITNGRVH